VKYKEILHKRHRIDKKTRYDEAEKKDEERNPFRNDLKSSL